MTADSRRVAPGFLFAALPGAKLDGRAFLADAAARGAAAFLVAKGTPKPAGIGAAWIEHDNPRRALALMAARFYGQQPRKIAAVTGTSGKTSTVHFAQSLWRALGLKAASLGTLGLIPAQPNPPAALTTPDPVDLHRCLAELAAAGFDHLAMEASSHGLDQYRLDGVQLAAAAFTNLSHDHLDYHPTMEAYLAAKCRLFDVLLPSGASAILNRETPQFEALNEIARRRQLQVIAIGRGRGEIAIEDHALDADGQTLTVALFGQRRRIRLNLIGAFQAANALTALALVIACDGRQEEALAALEKLTVVPGRLEAVGKTPKGGRVYVDYAHKPAALEIVLQTLRAQTPGRLHVVFGCGGDRDRAKRPLMGAIAARDADRAIVTDDNPRSEDAGAIRAEICAASPQLIEIGDRRTAIARAIEALGEGDVLVIAGKGHESGQIVGSTVLPFDDRAVAREIIAQSAGGAS